MYYLRTSFEWPRVAFHTLPLRFSGQPSSPRGNIKLPARLDARTSISVGDFQFERSALPNESVASGPEHTDRNTNGEHGVTSVHRRKLERNRSAGVPRQDVVNTESTLKLEPKTITGPIVFHPPEHPNRLNAFMWRAIYRILFPFFFFFSL